MSDSDMNVKSLDSDKDVTSGLHARSKRLERSTPDALGQRDGTQSHLVPTSVTITIPLDDAQLLDRRFAKDARMLLADERRMIEAIRAELRRRGA